MFMKKKKFINDEERGSVSFYYLRIMRRNVSVRKLLYLAVFPVLFILLITAEKTVLLPIEL